MTSINKKGVVGAACIALVSVSAATIWHVPGHQPTIQQMVDDPRVVDGDTISLWGIGSPPYVFNENIDYRDKSLHIANACYLPNPPAPPPKGE
jgi:hypothetical protein